VRGRGVSWLCGVRQARCGGGWSTGNGLRCVQEKGRGERPRRRAAAEKVTESRVREAGSGAKRQTYAGRVGGLTSSSVMSAA
jgi:hypothetical protein